MLKPLPGPHALPFVQNLFREEMLLAFFVSAGEIQFPKSFYKEVTNKQKTLQQREREEEKWMGGGGREREREREKGRGPDKFVFVLAQNLPVVVFFQLKEAFTAAAAPLSTQLLALGDPVFCYPYSLSDSPQLPQHYRTKFRAAS